MENINMTHVFKHPKFYRIPRDKSDQAISESKTVDIGDSVRPDPGLKLQAQCDSQEALQSQSRASSDKQQATSRKPQAPSDKHQAPSNKPQA